MAAPNQPSAASVVTVVGSDGSKWCRLTALARVDLNPLMAFRHAGDDRNGAPFLINSVRGFALWANPSI